MNDKPLVLSRDQRASLLFGERRTFGGVVVHLSFGSSTSKACFKEGTLASSVQGGFTAGNYNLLFMYNVPSASKQRD